MHPGFLVNQFPLYIINVLEIMISIQTFSKHFGILADTKVWVRHLAEDYLFLMCTVMLARHFVLVHKFVPKNV